MKQSIFLFLFALLVFGGGCVLIIYIVLHSPFPY